VTFNKNKDGKNCNFCGNLCCSKCRDKKRLFPNKSNTNSKLEKGDICKVCDRKFFIHEMLQDKNLQIEAQTAQLLGP